jgi:hypothetical protein
LHQKVPRHLLCTLTHPLQPDYGSFLVSLFTVFLLLATFRRNQKFKHLAQCNHCHLDEK